MSKIINNSYELLPILIKAEDFEVEFIKKNGEVRTMICEFESTRHIKSGIIVVRDIEISEYRSINLDTINKLVVNNSIYNKLYKKFVVIGKTTTYLIDKIEEILNEYIVILHSLDRKTLEVIYEELFDIDNNQKNAVNTLFAYFEIEDFFSYQILLDVISDKLEFISNISLEEIATNELYRINISVNHFDIYNEEYKPTLQEVSAFYFESDYGVLQIKHEEL